MIKVTTIGLTAILFCFSLSHAQDLKAPEVTGDTLCGAGLGVLGAISELDGTPGLQYNWYNRISADPPEWELIESIDDGIFVTPDLIRTTEFGVSVSLNGEESPITSVRVVISSTASVLEAPQISLCDSVILHGSFVRSADLDTANAAYQWQRYISDSNVGVFVDLTDATSDDGPVYVTKEDGFFRMVVTFSDGCKAISSGVEVTDENLIDAYIVGEDTICYDEPLPGDSVTTTLSSRSGRSFTRYLWEESSDGINFSPVSDSSAMLVKKPDNGLDSAVQYFRLTLTEQNCSRSYVHTLVWYLNPDPPTLTRLNSTDDFFYCETDPVESRTISINEQPDLVYLWYRLVNYNLDMEAMRSFSGFPLDFMQGLPDWNAEFTSVSDTFLTLDSESWGLYGVKVLDPRTQCYSYSQTLFAETAVAEIDIPFYCDGFPEFLSSHFLADTYSWLYSSSVSGPFTEIGTDTAYSIDPPSTFGEGYYQLIVSKNGCSDTSIVLSLHEVIPPPKPELTSYSYQVCPGDSVLLQSTSSLSIYTWFTPGETLTTADPYINVTEPGTYYLGEKYKPFCYSLSDPVELTHFNTPDSIEFDVDTAAICGPATVAITTGTPTDSYQWYFSETGSGFTAMPGETLSNLTIGEKGEYFISVTSSNGCTRYSETLTVTGFTDPDIQFFTDTARVCGGNISVELETAQVPGNQYLWLYSTTENGSYTPAPGSNTESSYQAGTEGFYKVAESEGTCSDESESIFVQVLSDSNPAFNASISGPEKLCLGDVETFESDYATASATYIWSYSTDNSTYTTISPATASTIQLDADDFSSLFVSDSLHLYLQLELFDSLCSSTSTPKEVTIYTQPDLQIKNTRTSNTDDVFFCNPGDINFKLVASQISTSHSLSYQWQYRGVDGQFQNISLQNGKEYTPSFAGTFRCASSVDGVVCTGTSNQIDLITIPDKVFVDKADFCTGELIELMADPGFQTSSSITQYDYQWYFSADGNIFQSLPDQTSAICQTFPEDVHYGSGYYYFLASNSLCIKISDTVRMVETFIEPDTILIDNASCLGIDDGSATLVFDETSAANLTFQLNDNPAQDSSLIYSNLGVGSYTVTIRNSLGCESIVSFPVFPKKETPITVTYDSLQHFDVPFFVNATGANTYQWEPENFFSQQEEPVSIATIPESFESDTATLQVYGTTDEGCIGYTVFDVYLSLADGLQVSKFISPDGDGQNDNFKITGLRPDWIVKLKVLDNWGNEIFFTSNYQENAQQAYLLSRAIKKEGMYFYLLEVEDKILKGSFYAKK